MLCHWIQKFEVIAPYMKIELWLRKEAWIILNYCKHYDDYEDPVYFFAYQKICDKYMNYCIMIGFKEHMADIL